MTGRGDFFTFCMYTGQGVMTFFQHGVMTLFGPVVRWGQKFFELTFLGPLPCGMDL